MTAELPKHPHEWPEPWRSLYYEEVAEREAIMIAENASPKSIAHEVKLIEDDLRKDFTESLAEA